MQALTSFPFTSTQEYDATGWPHLDRAVDSTVLRKLMGSYFRDGILLTADSTCFQVTAPTDDSPVVKVAPGTGLIQGATGYSEAVITLNLPAADLSLPRYDTVVLRKNDNMTFRNIYLDIITGTPSSAPVPPALTRSDSIWELGIANLYRNPNSTIVTGSNIEDTRLDSERCGQVNALDKIETEAFMLQLRAYYAEFVRDSTEWMGNQQTGFLNWVQSLREVLDENTAGHLQNQIGDLQRLDTTAKNSLVDAINEVAAKEVDVLDSGEEIMANTDEGKVAGAAGVKELISGVNSSLEPIDIRDEITVLSGYEWVSNFRYAVKIGNLIIISGHINISTPISISNVVPMLKIPDRYCPKYNSGQIRYPATIVKSDYMDASGISIIGTDGNISFYSNIGPVRAIQFEMIYAI